MKRLLAKKWAWLYILLPLAVIVLECLPYGAALHFAAPERDIVTVRTYSYFSLTPFGYANFSPLLTAICTCVLLAVGIVAVWTGKGKKAFFLAACIGATLSLCPLLLGWRYYTLVAGLISAGLIATAVWAYLFCKKSQ